MATSGKRWMPGVLTASLAALLWFKHHPTPLENPPGAQTASTRERHTETDREKERATADNTAKRRISGDWASLLGWLRSNPPPGTEEIRDRLAALRIEWTEADPQALAEAISRLLESGEDAPTGLGFKVGNHGFLADWPTLRVFLLDVLAASDPEMAQAIAKRLLDKTASAEEFATGLRSLTRQGMGRADNAELLARFDQMLEREEWQSSRGFAEALDLARFVGTADAVGRLVSWNGDPRLKSMAMNEFAAEHPKETVELLSNDTSLEAPIRASLMARADTEDQAQLSAVDAYLRAPSLSPTEATAFFKAFPLRSATTGYRLYGKTPAPYTFDRIAAGDRRAADLVNAWATDPALEKYRPDILALQQRLSKWIDQAK